MESLNFVVVLSVVLTAWVGQTMTRLCFIVRQTIERTVLGSDVEHGGSVKLPNLSPLRVEAFIPRFRVVRSRERALHDLGRGRPRLVPNRLKRSSGSLLLPR